MNLDVALESFRIEFTNWNLSYNIVDSGQAAQDPQSSSEGSGHALCG